jgi:hypothetical protein
VIVKSVLVENKRIFVNLVLFRHKICRLVQKSHSVIDVINRDGHGGRMKQMKIYINRLFTIPELFKMTCRLLIPLLLVCIIDTAVCTCAANLFGLDGETCTACPSNAVSLAASTVPADCQCEAGMQRDASACQERIHWITALRQPVLHALLENSKRFQGLEFARTVRQEHTAGALRAHCVLLELSAL